MKTRRLANVTVQSYFSFTLGIYMHTTVYEKWKTSNIQQNGHIFALIKSKKGEFLLLCVLHIDWLKILYAPPLEKVKSMTLKLSSPSS